MRLKSFIFVLLGVFLFLSSSCAQKQDEAQQKPKILLLIAEQNIEGPQRAWWMSEIDLSTVESTLAQRLIAQGYEILEPSVMNRIIRQEKAFRRADLPDDETIRLGKRSKADYVIVGKALATAGGSGVAGSNMRSCFANITAKLIRVSDGKVIDYLNAKGSTIHMDVVTGGEEALVSAANNLADKVLSSLRTAGGK